MSETRDELERVIGARAVGTVSVDGRDVPLAFASGEAEVVALLELAHARRWRVMPIGSGTKIARGPLRDKPKFALSVRGHSGVTAYERGDGTITARAGSAMAALAQVARTGGNHLSPDVAHAAHATLGGTLASGLSGIDRLRYGPLRNQVLGMRVALADGTIAKTGGRLVKNVTGYDLHRLYTGSRGSLCVILEASLRLFPAPESEVALHAHYHGRDAALDAADRVLASPIRATCVVVTSTSDGMWSLTVSLAGRKEPLAFERSTVATIVGEHVALEDRDARAHIEGLRDRESSATLRIGALRGELGRGLTLLDEMCGAKRLRAQLSIHPGIAYVDAQLMQLDGEASSAADVLDVARALVNSKAEVELVDAPLDARAAFDPLESSSLSARALMGRLKSALDPAGVLAGARPAPGA